MPQEYLAHALGRARSCVCNRLANLQIGFDIDSRAPGKSTEVVIGVLVEAQNSVPSRSRVWTNYGEDIHFRERHRTSVTSTYLHQHPVGGEGSLS